MDIETVSFRTSNLKLSYTENENGKKYFENDAELILTNEDGTRDSYTEEQIKNKIKSNVEKHINYNNFEDIILLTGAGTSISGDNYDGFYVENVRQQKIKYRHNGTFGFTRGGIVWAYSKPSWRRRYCLDESHDSTPLYGYYDE